MSSPQNHMLQMGRDDREHADAFYEVMLWIRTAKGIIEESEVDEFMAYLYALTSDGEKRRQEHNKKLARVKRRLALDANSGLVA